MRVSRIKSSEKTKQNAALHVLIFMSEFLLDRSCFWNYCTRKSALALLRRHKRFCEYCVITTNRSAHAAVCGPDFVHLFLNLCHLGNVSGFRGSVAFVKVSSACGITQARGGEKSYFYSSPSRSHPPLLHTPCANIFGKSLHVYLCNFVCVCVCLCGAVNV